MSTTLRSSSFQYQSRIDSSSLRLLQPFRISQEKLSFRVIQVPRSEAPEYSAVSYTWGDEPPSEVIYLNEQKFCVRPNLWSCLHYLGQPQNLYYMGESLPASPLSYLWVDAICINQNDDVEKTAQVRMMDQTYRGAAFVSVWLGLDSLPYPICIDEPIKTLETDRFDLHYSMADLSNRPYWSRVWVIQEFLLARHIQLHCSNWAFNVDVFKGVLCREAGVDQFSDDPLPNISRQSKSDPVSHAALPLTLGRHFNKHPDYLQPLYHLLIEHRKSRCSDPRDKIFGFIGLVTMEERRVLDLFFPDYELPEEHVLIITLAHLTQYGPFVTSMRDRQGPITSRSDDLFEALGVKSLAERERLLYRASQIPYVGIMSRFEMLGLLKSHDELELYEANLESQQGASAKPWPSKKSWSKTAKGAVFLLAIGICLRILNDTQGRRWPHDFKKVRSVMKQVLGYIMPSMREGFYSSPVFCKSHYAEFARMLYRSLFQLQ